jgi:hypothetical protein
MAFGGVWEGNDAPINHTEAKMEGFEPGDALKPSCRNREPQQSTRTLHDKNSNRESKQEVAAVADKL